MAVHNIILNQRGFTLLETLVTLGIITALLLLPSYSNDDLKAEMDWIYFINQFESLLSEQQVYSIVSGSDTLVTIADNKVNFYEGSNSEGVQAMGTRTLALPEGVQTYNRSYKFHGGTGIMNNNKGALFLANDRYVEVKFQFVFGRYYLKY